MKAPAFMADMDSTANYRLVKKLQTSISYISAMQNIRGGVEDTRLEAKAKDTKKNPRPRPRPRTAFPRTDTLEAKDRNARGQGQGPRTQAQVLSKKKKKKKGLHKNFSSDLHKNTFSKKFFKRSAKLQQFKK